MVHKLHHFTTNTVHYSSSPNAPRGLTGDLTTAGAHHLTVDQLSRAPTSQIDPTIMTLYSFPCYATTPTTQNRITSEETLSSRRRQVPPPLRADHCFPPMTMSPLPLAGMWARTHSVVPMLCPVGMPSWAGRPCGRAHVLGWAEIPPDPFN
jgi:hypothetical protein